MKIAIIGYSGSGKSTLAKNIGHKLNIPVLHLDCVQFLANWEERDLLQGQMIVSEFMENSSWIIDGNYDKFLFNRRMKEADKIIFLNFSRFNCLYRAFKRYLANKGKTREDMAKGCIEKMDMEFVWWILKEGRSKNLKSRNFEIIEKYKNKTIVFKNQKEIDSKNDTILSW